MTSQAISVSQLIHILWRAKWWMLVIPLFTASLVFFVVKGLPDVYRSEVLLAPTEANGSALQLGQLGGIAALAGIQMNNQTRNQARLAADVLVSRQFLTQFIAKYELTAPLYAAIDWDRKTNKLIYDSDIYDEVANNWSREPVQGRGAEPSLLEVYEVLLEQLTVHRNIDTGMLTVSLEHYSPTLSQYWLTLLVTELNEYMKLRDIQQAQQSLHYLQQQLTQTNIEEIRQSMFQLIEEQTKTLMLANVTEEYVYQTIDPAVVPELPSGPKRLLITLLALVLSALFTFMLILLRWFNRNHD
ncbi:Wzz/FepE/Etk N-terminal domain-containing protein [Rheinheimera baltica]|uniref:Wzz/FepE/Etk N-terminal domain-containing protein n=1 Tax=Rheinheimera baltica TaxID=67576 RepID=A0ABT9HUZ2_9GAMM|nr:Wzz/FepE/Etk N-terminal domain-containing protein [Rheinheimera baltica]MDP5134938.1 Wzz/FepE/Etk N-terminal domain-containing protein [Rheinheimera baltica]